MKVKLFTMMLVMLMLSCTTVHYHIGSKKSDQEKIFSIVEKQMKSVVVVRTTILDILCLTPDPKSCAIVERHVFGTGFMVDKRKGLFVTNHHVIENNIYVELLVDKKVTKVKVLTSSEKEDVALLKIEDSKSDFKDDLKEVRFGTDYKVGERVVLIGHPLGLKNSVSTGIISALREIYIQTDAAINSGNSGGPMFNLYGEFIGMNTFMYTTTGGNMGLNFAVNSKTVKKIIKKYLK